MDNKDSHSSNIIWEDARIDTHGARAPFYLIPNTDNGLTEILPNPVSHAERGAGLQAAVFLSSKGVDYVTVP